MFTKTNTCSKILLDRPQMNKKKNMQNTNKGEREMQLNSLECPKCGATLTADFSSGRARCRFCDSEYYFSNCDAGGRNDLETLERLVDQSNRIYNLEAKYEGIVKRKNTLYYLRIALWCVCILCVFLCVLYIAAVFKQEAFNWKGFLTAFFAAPLAFLLTKPVSAKMEQRFAEMDAVKAEENQIALEYKTDMLPKEYRTREHIQAFYNLVSTGRASTIPEAIRAYEEQKYHEKMIRMQEEQLEMQKKLAERSAREEQEDDSSDSINWKSVGLLIGSAVLFHKFFDD